MINWIKKLWKKEKKFIHPIYPSVLVVADSYQHFKTIALQLNPNLGKVFYIQNRTQIDGFERTKIFVIGYGPMKGMETLYIYRYLQRIGAPMLRIREII